MIKKQNHNKTNKHEMTPLRRYLPVTCTFAIGVLVSFILFTIVNNWEHENQRIEFESRSMGYANAVQSTVHDYVEGLKFLGDFFNNSEQVTRKEFSDFSLSAIARHPGIQAFGWNPLILNNERAYYESLARENGFENFMFTERTEEEVLVKAAQRDEYVIVYYIEPLESNKPALGYDIASNPTRLKAISQGFDTGNLSATERITLVQEEGEQFGILLLFPIYKQSVPLKTLEDRRKHRKGFVVEVLRIGDIVEDALKNFSDEGIDMYLYDLSAEEANRFLYFRPSRTTEMTKQYLEKEEIKKGLYWSKGFNIAGRQWQMLFSPSSFYLNAQQSWHAWIVLSGSLLLTCMLAFYLSRKSIYTAEIEQRVKKQTQTNLELEKEITERKQAEDVIEKIFNMTGYMVCTADLEGYFLRVNKSFEQILGYTSEELLGQPYVNLIHPDDKQKTLDIIENEMSQGIKIIGFENRYRCKDRTYKWLSWTAQPDPETGDSYAIAYDITERKQAEQESEVYTKRLEKLNELSMMLSGDPIDIFQNAARMIGELLDVRVVCLSEIRGDELFFISVYAGGEVMTDVGSCPLSITPCATVHNAKDIRVFDNVTEMFPEASFLKMHNAFSYCGFPSLNSAGDVNAVTCLLDDKLHDFSENDKKLLQIFGQRIGLEIERQGNLSKHKKVEEERERLNAELKLKNVELEQVVYVTSHDLRTPLVNIDGYNKEIGRLLKELALIVESDGISAEVKEKIDVIVEKDIPRAENYITTSVSRMDALLSGLLQISRLGRFEINEGKLDINKTVSEIIDTINYQVEKAGAKIELSELPSCTGDEKQINQLFSNLIGNALKYLDPNRNGVISVSGKKEDNYSVYCVEDNGVGISPDHQEKIFEIFYQLKPKRSPGEGLGLTIVKKVVDIHHGKTWVESKPGKGSKFYVSLPNR